MELTLGLQGQIIAAYVPCMAMHGNQGPYMCSGISIMEGMAHFEWDDDADWWNFDQAKLILTPLSKITKEHAVELTKIYHGNCDDFELGYDPFLHENIDFNGFERIKDAIEVIDFLRSKSYDCGYGNIKSLIAAGIAIEEQPLNGAIASKAQ